MACILDDDRRSCPLGHHSCHVKYLADREEGNTQTNYRIVAILTGITGVTTFFDFWFEAKWITMFTISMGSIATFTSAGTLITVTDQNTILTPILGMWARRSR